MICIAPGLLAACCFLYLILDARSSVSRQVPKRHWKRPFVLRIPSESEERVIGIALAICGALTASFVLAIFTIYLFGN